MLEFLRNLTSSGPLYVRIKANCLSVKNVSTGKRFEDVPVVAVTDSGDPVVLSIGKDAERDAKKQGKGYALKNGFDHPRTIIADFAIAEKTLMHFIREVAGSGFIKASPVIIMHPLEHLEGGLTVVEARALQELAAGAGGREVYVWTGRELMDQEIKSGNFPGDHWAANKPKWAKA